MIHVLGIMTGTSCDGADLALVRFSVKKGAVSETIVRCSSKPFPALLRKRLLHAMEGTMGATDAAFLQRDYSLWISGVCKQFLRNVSEKNVLIAIHGQTVWHSPPKANDTKPGVSLQLVDPTIISFETKCSVASHFRQPDLARRGQGAPMVPYYHWLRAQESRYKKDIPFGVHNVGGIANLTVVTKNIDHAIAFDTGPGNALIDLATEKHTKGRLKFDRNGNFASRKINEINWKKINSIVNSGYFKKAPPKSTGRELFNKAFLKKLPGTGELLIANATGLTAYSMARAYNDFVFKKYPSLKKIYICGGGADNKTLVTLFDQWVNTFKKKKVTVCTLPKEFAPHHYLEAIAFARFGLEAIQGKRITVSTMTGAKQDSFGAGLFPGRNFSKLLKSADML